MATPSDVDAGGEYREASVKLSRPEPPVFGTHLADRRIWVYSNGGDVVDSTLTKYTLDQALDRELMAFQNGQETATAVTSRIAPIIGAMLREGTTG